MSYSDHANLEASEKIILAQINASKFIKGFVIHSGSVYKITGFSYIKIVSIKDSGMSLSEVFSIGSVVAGSFYYDRQNETLYLRTLDSVNPNSKKIVMVFMNFFSNVPVVAPWDLGSGYRVEWIPIISQTSQFGVEIDNQIDQLGISIDGSGSINLLNDKTYWSSRFDKWYWINNEINIYSWGRSLAFADAKLLFNGTIQSKSYSNESVSFSIADNFFKIRQSYPLDILGNEGTYPLVFAQTLKRQIFGKANGVRLQNIDQLINGEYKIDLSNNISSATSTVLTFNNPIVYTYFRKGDSIRIDNVGSFSIKSVLTASTLEIATQLSTKQQSDVVGVQLWVKPSNGRPYFNRTWKIAGHALYEPSATITAIVAQNAIQVDDASKFYEGYEYYGGFDDSFFANKTIVEKIRLNTLIFNNSVGATATIGAIIKMSPAQNVMLDTNELRLGFTHSIDASNAKLQLIDESYITPRKILTGTLTFTNGSTLVTGVGTKFTSELNDLSKVILHFGETTSYQVVDVIDDTNMRISINWPLSTVSTTDAECINVEYFKNDTNVLSCDVFGATDDDTKDGNIVDTGPLVCKYILTKLGFGSKINNASFALASEIADYKIGLVIPSQYNDRKAPQTKEIINLINKSIFGIITQDSDFKFKYSIIRPDRKEATLLALSEKEILGFEITTDSADIIKSVTLGYDIKEYNSSTGEQGTSFVTQTSDIGNYLASSIKTFSVDTVLNNITDAQIMASRYAFYLSFSRSSVSMETKLQTSDKSLSDKIKLSHRYLFERIGLSDKTKIVSAMNIKKNAFGVVLEGDDLGNSLSSAAIITENTAQNYSLSDSDQILVQGYITDDYGMQNNDAETYGQNLIW